MRTSFAAVLLLSAFAVPADAQLPAWLAGCWELRSGNKVTLEMWMPPAGGLMLGASRTVANGAVREFEQVMLKVEGGQLVYTAKPSGQAEASFTLVARIEGPGPSGTQGFDFPMRRITCTQ